MNRRTFLETAALAAAGATVRSARAAAEGGAALNAFSKPLDWLDRDAMADALAAAGFTGIDLTVRPKGSIEPEHAARDLPLAVESARKRGLKVDMIVTSLGSADEPFAETILKTAADCGVKVYRMGYLRYDEALGIEGSIERFRTVLAGLEALNRKCGITGCYQNHFAWGRTMFGGAVWDLHLALKGLDPRWIGCQYDIRHAVAEAGGAWEIGLLLIAPYIRSICLKDFVWGKRKDRWAPDSVFSGEGMVPWDRYFTVLKELKLSVPATVHCEWQLFTPEEAAKPEPERRAIAIAKMKRDRDFFAAAYAKHGLA